MAAATIHSENVTNILAGTTLDRKVGTIKTVIDQIATLTTNVDDANDMWLFGPIPSNAVIIDILVKNDDLDGVSDLEGDFGLVYSGIGQQQVEDGNTIGTEIDFNVFADASTIFQAANTGWTSVRSATDNIVDTDLEAWQVGGLTEDPGGLFFVNFRVGTPAATDQAGDTVMRIDYIAK